MQKPSPTRLLNICCKEGLAWAELHGYRWFRLVFLPAIEALQSTATTNKSKLLLSKSYHLLGDLYFVHDAPKASIKAYRQALLFAPNNAEILQDIADVLFMLGRYKESWQYQKRLCCVNARSRDEALRDFANFDRSVPQGYPVFTPDDLRWLACERLAIGQPHAALRLLKNKRGIHTIRIRMMAFGVMEDCDAVLENCSRMARMSGAIEWSTADWFFLPATLWETPKFWETMLAIVPRCVNLGLNSPSSDTQGPPELLNRAGKVKWPTIYHKSIEFHLARTRADTTMLRRLLQQYPRWRDCRIALQHVQRTGKPLTRDELFLAFAKDSQK